MSLAQDSLPLKGYKFVEVKFCKKEQKEQCLGVD
jgi:hypothetical protein